MGLAKECVDRAVQTWLGLSLTIIRSCGALGCCRNCATHSAEEQKTPEECKAAKWNSHFNCVHPTAKQGCWLAFVVAKMDSCNTLTGVRWSVKLDFLTGEAWCWLLFPTLRHWTLVTWLHSSASESQCNSSTFSFSFIALLTTCHVCWWCLLSWCCAPPLAATLILTPFVNVIHSAPALNQFQSPFIVLHSFSLLIVCRHPHRNFPLNKHHRQQLRCHSHFHQHVMIELCLIVWWRLRDSLSRNKCCPQQLCCSDFCHPAVEFFLCHLFCCIIIWKVVCSTDAMTGFEFWSSMSFCIQWRQLSLWMTVCVAFFDNEEIDLFSFPNLAMDFWTVRPKTVAWSLSPLALKQFPLLFIIENPSLIDKSTMLFCRLSVKHQNC